MLLWCIHNLKLMTTIWLYLW